MNNLTRPEIIIITSRPALRRRLVRLCECVLVLVLLGLLAVSFGIGRWLWKYTDWVIIVLWFGFWFVVSLKVTGWF